MLRTEEGGIVNTVLAGLSVRKGIVAVAEIARIVVVEQVVVARLAVRIDRSRQRLEIVHDRSDARLVLIRAFGIGPAAVRGRAEGPTAIAVFRVPVIRAAGWIGIFDFVHHPAFALPAATSTCVEEVGRVLRRR